MKRWANLENSNTLVKTGEGFCVARFSPDPREAAMIAMMEKMTGHRVPDRPIETVLMRGTDNFKLIGDHTAAYDPLIDDSWEACFSYYMANKDKIDLASVPMANPIAC